MRPGDTACSVSDGLSASSSSPGMRIALLVRPRKEQKFQAFLDLCKRRGVHAFFLQWDVPFHQQGDFDVLIHKTTEHIVAQRHGDAAETRRLRQLRTLLSQRRHTLVLDPFDSVAALTDRGTLFQQLSQMSALPFRVPAMCVLRCAPSELKPNMPPFPVICKPLDACGSADAHTMHVVCSVDAMQSLTYPCLVQEFLNHSGRIYKAYTVGATVWLRERPSIRNFSASDLASDTVAVFQSQLELPPELQVSEADGDGASMPPSVPIPPPLSQVAEASAVLARELQISLFGFDILADERSGQYYIVDVNCFPGYKGVDEFFPILADYAVQRFHQNRATMLGQEAHQASAAGVQPLPLRSSTASVAASLVDATSS